MPPIVSDFWFNLWANRQNDIDIEYREFFGFKLTKGYQHGAEQLSLRWQQTTHYDGTHCKRYTISVRPSVVHQLKCRNTKKLSTLGLSHTLATLNILVILSLLNRSAESF